MATEKQIAANRANAQHSTGPKTEEGKTRVAGNRRTHSLAGRHVILPDESQADYDALLAEFVKDHQPACTYEDTLVHQMAEAHWKLRRIGRYEAELLEKYPNPFLDDEGAKKLAQLTRYEAAARRASHKAYEDLRRYRADKQKQEARVAALLEAVFENVEERGSLRNSNPISREPHDSTNDTPATPCPEPAAAQPHQPPQPGPDPLF